MPAGAAAPGAQRRSRRWRRSSSRASAQIDLFAAAPRPDAARRPGRRAGGIDPRSTRRRALDPDIADASRGARRALPPQGLASETSAMTYCVGIQLDAGLVFLSDSRTNAGLDQIGTFRKMIIYERPGDRFMVLLSAGNLSISQSVREILQVEKLDNGARAADHDLERDQHVRRRARARRRGAPRLRPGRRRRCKASGIDFNASMIFGGQIGGEAMRLFLVYSAGNFIEATRETLLLPDRREQVRQAHPRPHDHAGDAARRGRQVRAGVDGLDAEVQPLGRPAARPRRLRGQRAAERRRSSASTTATPTSR